MELTLTKLISMDIILIVLLVCGQPDTFIVKEPDKQATYTHDIYNNHVNESILEVLKTDPVVIMYEEDRGRCA